MITYKTTIFPYHCEQAAAIKAPLRTFAQATAGSARKVQMSNFEKDQHINYQRIEDNLAIVRKRQVSSLFFPLPLSFSILIEVVH